MSNICISSDVTSSYLLLDRKDIRFIPTLLSIEEGDIIPFSIKDEGLILLKNDLVILIKKELHQLDASRKTGAPIEFNNTYYNINFRSSHGYFTAALIGLHDIVLKCIVLKGSLHIYNREPIKQYMADDIIAYLRFKGGQTIETIQSGLNLVYSKLSDPKGIIYDPDDVIRGLALLYKNGFISFEEQTREYFLTARGYMIR
ncbi:hypothetical protein [Deminuibacter soli]|uniref:Uncharacterized protein n=1 Tax=Deminuibacter soli TaxID=2291815 RepID=A0A3E1NCM2_9BACT|nr:hypothetical protein [Deminuibacter soli]RFM25564.1 hypothetical protein DXN05_24425 [Deminuibacter soli]